MAATTYSATSNELLLRSALEKENMSFKEQHRIYEKGNDLQPKYVADFIIFHGDRAVIVECDGFAYHSSDLDVERDIQRDKWIEKHGYGKVLHFTAFQLRYEMETVIRNIKYYLGIARYSKEELHFRRKKTRKTPIINCEKKDLHKVTLYYSVAQMQDKVWLVYKFQDNTLNKFSEERVKVFYNVPDKYANELAVYTALKDLKRSVDVLVYCPSEWLVAYFNRLTKNKRTDTGMIDKIDALLCKHNYLFKYISLTRDASYYKSPSDERFILSELRSRCRQVRYGKYSRSDYNKIDFLKFD